jgi:hypothetical protein
MSVTLYPSKIDKTLSLKMDKTSLKMDKTLSLKMDKTSLKMDKTLSLIMDKTISLKMG